MSGRLCLKTLPQGPSDAKRNPRVAGSRHFTGAHAAAHGRARRRRDRAQGLLLWAQPAFAPNPTDVRARSGAPAWGSLEVTSWEGAARAPPARAQQSFAPRGGGQSQTSRRKGDRAIANDARRLCLTSTPHLTPRRETSTSPSPLAVRIRVHPFPFCGHVRACACASPSSLPSIPCRHGLRVGPTKLVGARLGEGYGEAARRQKGGGRFDEA